MAAGGIAAEVPMHADNYRRHFSGAALTPLALAKWWARCARPRRGRSPEPRSPSRRPPNSMRRCSHEPLRGAAAHREDRGGLPADVAAGNEDRVRPEVDPLDVSIASAAIDEAIGERTFAPTVAEVLSYAEAVAQEQAAKARTRAVIAARSHRSRRMT